MSWTERKTDSGVTLLFADIDRDCSLPMPPLPEADGMTAVWLYCRFWCRPEFPASLSDVPPETQLLVLRLKTGGWQVLLPLCGDIYKCTLAGAEDGLNAVFYSGVDEPPRREAPAVAIAEGDDPHALLRLCAAEGVKAAGGFAPLKDGREYPEIFEYLGWCSWDALQIRINERDLLAKCREFKEKKIPVRWMILDDMWADVRDLYAPVYNDFKEMCSIMHASKLYRFEGDPTRFPQGLAHCVAAMREEGFTVGAWHPINGYWFGIDPEGPLPAQLDGALVETEDGKLVPGFTEEQSFKFFDSFHRFLESCGIEFVKIDNQSNLRYFCHGKTPVCTAARQVHTAMERSVAEHFGGRLINCMGLGSEDMFHRPYSAVSRCSDDFMPENKAWFTKHILQCSYNSLLQGEFLWCDWDMWWTDDGQAVKNSLLRAVSGGPIYVSDKIGRSRPEVLEPLCLSDGRILRCDRPAVPSADCIVGDPRSCKRAFKVQNVCGDSGVIAVFDLDEGDAPVEGSLSPADCGLPAGKYALREYFSGDTALLLPGESLRFTLNGGDDFRLYVLVPIKDGFAPFGDPGKMISPKTVLSASSGSAELCEDAPFLFYSASPVTEYSVNGHIRPVEDLGGGFFRA